MGDIRWVFDELPPSGARRGGDPSEHAFRRDLESLVREVIQNANDQAITWPRIRFRLRALEGAALEAYLDALRFSTLRPHLEGAASSRGGAALSDFLEAFDAQRRLLVLDIEDRGTVGLVGHESEGESHFRALCKDTLYSHKAKASAGGSYGLGKSVLWTFSGLSTVLFNSQLMDTLEGQESPRLIGRTELPSHRVEADGWFTGSGWFGRVAHVEGRGLRAESVWGDRAAEVASALHLERDPDQMGTTIQIVGFRDPTREDEDPAGVAERIAAASARYFWPAMVERRRGMRVAVATGAAEREVSARDRAEVRPFIECYEGRGDAGEALERPGDVAVRTIEVDIPPRRDGRPRTTGQVDLVVRLAHPQESGHRWLSHVAMFRGPGMVVRYWDRRGLTLGARPFHALLVAGEARAPRSASAADEATEQFLRAAEPPGHDEWLPTPALRQGYKQGWGKSLKRLHDRITEELKLLLAPRVTQGRKGPDRLQKRFPIGPRGSKGSGPSAFRFSGLEARFDGARWHFGGTVEPVSKRRPWQATVELRELGDGGAPLDAIPIEAFELAEPDGELRLEGGVAHVRAPSRLRSLRFDGRSVSLADRAEPPAELSFEVTGRLGAS